VYQKAARSGAYDLVIFDRCAPESESDMPRANTMFIGHPPPPWSPQSVQKIEFPHIKGWMSKHRTLRYLTALYEIGISEAFKMNDLPPRAPRLMESDQDSAVMLTLSRGPFTDLVLTFALIDDEGRWVTNWPRMPSFPLFLLNVLHAYGNVPDSLTDEVVQPGQLKIIRSPGNLRRVEITGPDGRSQVVSRDDRDLRTDLPFGGTDAVGVYRVKGDSFDTSFAVNLLDKDESNIEPRPTIQIGAETVASAQQRSQPREIWWWFALAALAILLVEWYVYNRRVFI